jgi:transposase
LKYVAGVDTHRDSHSIAILNELGTVIDAFTIEATPSGYAEAVARTASISPLVWGLEGTGSYGRGFADALIALGNVVYEVPGAITKRHRRRLRKPGKSDPQDAHAIAEAVLREDDTLPRHLHADEAEATRLLYDRRDRLVRDQTVKVNRIRALTLRLGLATSSDLTSGRALNQLEDSLNAKTATGYAEIELIDEVRELIADLRRIQTIVSALEKRMRPFVERLAPELLKLRGCSVISASGLIGHTGAMDNYSSSDSFAARAGVAPIPCASGKHQAVRLNIGGNRQLNRCLHNIANTQMRSDGHIGKIYYDRKRTEGKTHRAAMRCLKRKLANVVFHSLKATAAAASATAHILSAA